MSVSPFFHYLSLKYPLQTQHNLNTNYSPCLNNQKYYNNSVILTKSLQHILAIAALFFFYFANQYNSTANIGSVCDMC